MQRNKYPIAWAVLLWLAASSPLLSIAQNLDDFKSAAGSKGVQVIPFPDLRSKAVDLAADVDKRKTEVQSLSYETFEKQKDNMLKDIKKRQEDITGIQKEIEEYKKNFTEVSVTCFEEDIKKKKEKIDGFNNQLNELNSKLKSASEAFGNLNEARAKLREQFDRVLRELSSAKSSPEKYLGSSPTDDDKKNFVRYCDIIEDEIEAQAKTHKDQEDGAKGTKEKYEKLIDKKEIQ